jgi:hypothetical protein
MSTNAFMKNKINSLDILTRTAKKYSSPKSLTTCKQRHKSQYLTVYLITYKKI